MKPSKKRSLLVIGDNPTDLSIIENILAIKFPNIQVTYAHNPGMATAHLEERLLYASSLPSLILLDLYPHPLAAWQLLQDFRKQHPHIPIIVLTASKDYSDISTPYQLGAHSCVIKPLDVKEWEEFFEILIHYWFETVLLH